MGFGPKITSAAGGSPGDFTHNLLNTFGQAFGMGVPGPGSIEGAFSQIGDPLQRLAGQAAQNFLGMSPGSVGLGAATSRALQDPSIAAREAIMPIFARQMNEGLGTVFAKLGGMGGRYGATPASLGSSFAADLAQKQAMTLGDLSLRGQEAQNQALASIIPGFNQSAAISQQGLLGVLGPLFGLAAPGAQPIASPGVGSQLLNLGGTLGGAALGAGMNPFSFLGLGGGGQ